MAILVMCTNPQCGELFDAPDEAVGTEIPCPSCGTILTVSGPEEPTPTDQSADEAPPSSEAPRPADQPPPGQADLKPLKIADVEADAEPAEQQPPPEGEQAGQAGIDLSPKEARPQWPAYQAYEIPTGPVGQQGPTEAPPELEIESEEAAGEVLSPFEADMVHTEATPQAPDEGVLESRKVVAVPFVIGMVGIGTGLAAGVSWYPSQPIVGAYVGSVAGWVVGFIFALMVVFAIDREGLRKVRCVVCDNIFRAGTDACSFCGSKLPTQMVSPLAADCLKAGSYALSDKASVYWMTMLAVVVSLMMVGVYHLLEFFPRLSEGVLPGVIGFCAIIAVCVFGYLFEFFGKTVADTIARLGGGPSLPPFRPFRNILCAVKVLLVVLVYVVPVFTFPLLPLGMLALGARGRRRLFDLSADVRVAWRHTRDFAILWLLLLLWFAAMALGIALTMMAVYLLRGVIPPVGGSTGIVFTFIISTTAAVMAGVVVCVFGLALFRCVAIFARYNPEILRPLTPVSEGPPETLMGEQD